jgi:hypothetical protein
MLKFSKLAALLAVGLMTLMWGAPAQAQASRTWVSGVGDDANPCSRTAPCKTFAGAISKTAAFGEIDCLDPGGFGAVTITKSITIDCQGTLGSILSAGTNGIIVNVTATDLVKIRNITINGFHTGINGIRMIGGGSLVIEHVALFGMTGAGIDWEPNLANAKLSVLDTEVQFTGTGVLLKAQASVLTTALLDHVTAWNNTLHGVEADDGITATVIWSDLSHNGGKGALVASASVSSVVNFDHTTFAQNLGQGLVVSGTNGLARISDTAYFNNGGGAGMLVLASGRIFGFQNNHSAQTGTPTNNIPPI